MLQKDEIGLSTCHRDSTRLQLGDAVHLRLLIPPIPKPVIALMHINVSTYVKPRKTPVLQNERSTRPVLLSLKQ